MKRKRYSGHTKRRIKTLNRNERDVEGYKAVLYGNYALNATDFVEGYALVGRNDNETRRDMTVGALNSVARGDHESVFTQIYTGMGSRYRISDAFAFTPGAECALYLY